MTRTEMLGDVALQHPPPPPPKGDLHKSEKHVENMFNAFLGTYDERDEVLFAPATQLERDTPKSRSAVKSIQPIPPRPGAGPMPMSAPEPTTVIPPMDEAKLKELREMGVELRKMGDKVDKDYGNKIASLGMQVSKFVVQNAIELKYENFQAHLNALMEDGDMNATNLLLLMLVGKKVVASTSAVCGSVREYFGRYIGQRFGERVSEVEDMGEFIKGASSSSV